MQVIKCKAVYIYYTPLSHIKRTKSNVKDHRFISKHKM